MLLSDILSNAGNEPDYYPDEILDLPEVSLYKTENAGKRDSFSRGVYGARKGDYIETDIFDEPLEDFEDYI